MIFLLFIIDRIWLIYCNYTTTIAASRSSSSNLFIMILLRIHIKLIDFFIKLIPIWIKLVKSLFVVSKEIYGKCWKQYAPESSPIRYLVHNCVVNHFVLKNILTKTKEEKNKTNENKAREISREKKSIWL